MFGPNQSGGCDGCSMFVDGIAHLAHLHARDTSLALVSRAPLEKLEAGSAGRSRRGGIRRRRHTSGGAGTMNTVFERRASPPPGALTQLGHAERRLDEICEMLGEMIQVLAQPYSQARSR